MLFRSEIKTGGEPLPKRNPNVFVILYHHNMQAVRVSLNCGVNISVRNLDGHIAQDMLQEQTHVEIRDMLSHTGALRCLFIPTNPQI